MHVLFVVLNVMINESEGKKVMKQIVVYALGRKVPAGQQ